MDNVTISNVVDKNTLRSIQKDTLAKVAKYLEKSFGPFGSTTIIKKDGNAATYYTKDGHDILKNIKFNGVIESTIVDDLIDITKHVVKTIGDGTTSAIELADMIFPALCTIEQVECDSGSKYKCVDYSTREIVNAVNSVIHDITYYINNLSRPCELEDIYNIAYTSTDGNDILASNICNIYQQNGMNTFIDLEVSTTSNEDIIKTYDGMTVAAGYTDPIFVNSEGNTCRIVNPRIYVFDDPVDNGEMIALFDKIIYNNIYKAYESGSISEPIPTVIIAPKISNDMSAYFASIANFMMKFNGNQKPPLVIVSSYYNADEMNDIAIMCGVPSIKKYITEEAKKSDIEAGRAPTMENVVEFYGTCGEVVIDSDTSKFIDPKFRYNEDGSDHPTFTSLKNWIETELNKNIESDGDLKARTSLRKRLNSLNANLVEYFVGGISIADRDNNRALLEDAIKACRSAVENGVGYGANTMGLITAYHVYNDYAEYNKSNFNEDTEADPEKDIKLRKAKLLAKVSEIIYNAYENLAILLYTTAPSIDSTKAKSIIHDIIDSTKPKPSENPDGRTTDPAGNGPINLRTMAHDKTVLTSITADIEVLNAVGRIITLMAVSNQFILPNPQYNVYVK